MTILFIIAFVLALFGGKNTSNKKYTKSLYPKTTKPETQATLQPVMVVELRRYDGSKLEERTDIQVLWVNSSVCFAEDDLPYTQFSMGLTNGEKVSLPLVKRDGEYWAQYQDKEYNDWNIRVRYRKHHATAKHGHGVKVSTPRYAESTLA